MMRFVPHRILRSFIIRGGASAIAVSSGPVATNATTRMTGIMTMTDHSAAAGHYSGLATTQ
jgi:hypothetical protein